MGGIKTYKGSSRSRRQLSVASGGAGAEELRTQSHSKHGKDKRSGRSSRKGRVHPEHRSSSRAMDGGEKRRASARLSLTVQTVYEDEQRQASHSQEGVRTSRDWRSPGAQKTPLAQVARHTNDGQVLPDFITQTDANGNATTPRSAAAINGARMARQSGQKPPPSDRKGRRSSDRDGDDGVHDGNIIFSPDDPCDTLFESLRMMCCCLMEDGKPSRTIADGTPEVEDRPRLLGPIHPDDQGKKCLVLDLDETLVHSSFRAVPGADFVIPVQIEDVVHFVYVAKRPGVDEFLVEMAKHYEIVIYTASLNKYADPLLDLLDPQKTIRYRLFRESCVYYEGNYVKDLNLLNRELKDTIIIDNSPNSYLFHPENAIDCSSFIDDKRDRELDQIGSFLKGIKRVKDVRGISPQWRQWPNIDLRGQSLGGKR